MAHAATETAVGNSIATGGAAAVAAMSRLVTGERAASP